MSKNGFTLFEALLSVMVLGTVSTGIILKEVENRNKDQRLRFIDEAMSIVKAVDHRIAIDGYDPDLWTKLKWDNEEDIVNSLIKEDLTSQYHDKCSGGKWKPAINSENNTKLLECNLWQSRKNHGETIKAELREDSLGFIQGFDLFISFDDIANFKKYFRDIKYSVNQISVNPSQEISGIYINSLVSTSSGVDISSYECINDPLDCSIKLSLERSGGNEYLRADGGNSMIGDHISFIESKGESPLKCLRWSNTERDGSGTWSKVLDEDCGIGIYEKTGQPVMVETVVDTGTFKNVALDKECVVYEWDGTKVVDSGNVSPCGMTNDGTEVYQVIQNIRAKNIEAMNIKASQANFYILNVDNLISKTITAEQLNAITELKTNLIKEYTAGAGITLEDNVTINDLLNVRSNVNVTGDINTGGNIYGANIYATGEVGSNSIRTNYITTTNLNTTNANTTNLTAEGTTTLNGTTNLNGTTHTNGTVNMNGRVNANEYIYLGRAVSEGAGCSTGMISRTSNGTFVSCVNGVWKKNSSSPKTVVRTGHFSSTNGYYNGDKTVHCASDEIIVGGGGNCYVKNVPNLNTTRISRSYPSGNGWTVGCVVTQNYYSYLDVYAICMKK